MSGATHRGDVYDLAVELARPVARGLLPRSIADATILMTALRCCDGRYDPIDTAQIAAFVLRRRARDMTMKRDVAESRIIHSLRPLIARREPKNVLLHAAHDVNGAAGFPLSETEVDSIVATQVWWSLRRRTGNE
jgi:hypothetical protein